MGTSTGSKTGRTRPVHAPRSSSSVPSRTTPGDPAGASSSSSASTSASNTASDRAAAPSTKQTASTEKTNTSSTRQQQQQQQQQQQRRINPVALNAYAVNQLSARKGGRTVPPRSGAGAAAAAGSKAFPEKYNSVARKVTFTLVALPIAIVTSYFLYERLVTGVERKRLVTAEEKTERK
ncbi:hypothetical protein L228DRAFT_242596 [Xylona heveae TC161]|uniref:Uncharacterized protein n=1 Tax=Xylona heveae (strain CBS 132557 / TC161) TaxID=1328760 RepID=A0A165JFL9_XYLHT|nr:hypothetical protein L228DRAFT_242596 [Xylona heveae TC161]KZF26172.1 hypothetical protein L228DRAFT_242596 [Xylona heveae TC161]